MALTGARENLKNIDQGVVMSVKYCQGRHSSTPDHVIDQIKGPAEVHKVDKGTFNNVRRTIMGKPIGILGFDKTYLNEPKH